MRTRALPGEGHPSSTWGLLLPLYLGVRTSVLCFGGVLSLLYASDSLSAQESAGTIAGSVVDSQGNPLPSVRITHRESSRHVLSNTLGEFILEGVTAGQGHLQATIAGYRTNEYVLSVTAEETLHLSLVLPLDPITLDAITVTGTMQRISVAESPVKVEVIPSAILQRSTTNNLTEALQFVNGLTNQVDCGVCYTNGIRIHGMEGPYTAVLIDGMPLMSSLASVYGLNGINPAFIEQVEIIKGPSSTLYGSEAMGGVINVITKDPRFVPRFTIDLSSTSDLEGNIDVAAASEPGDLSAFFGANLAYNNRFVDRNQDNFSDFPLSRRGILFTKVELAPAGQRKAMLTAKFLYEDRFGGVSEWIPSLRGSGQVYGESIYTSRLELMGSYLFPTWSGFRFEGSYTWHDQDSWYGDTRYAARQYIIFGNLLWNREVGRHRILFGATARWQRYDDDTPATIEAEHRFIPGLFIQDEVHLLPTLTLLGGTRLDHHIAHGTIVSPRLAIRWSPSEHTTLRLNAGTGFRVVSLFTEDHAALTGSREVLIAEELLPERSRSLTLNLNQIVEFGPHPMTIDVDLFHTRFSNRIRADYDIDPNLIVYDNLRGHAVSTGVSMAMNQNVDFDRLLWTVGVTWQEVYTVEDQGKEEAFFAPNLRATLGATYRFRSFPLRLDYTGTVTGSVRLPEYLPPFERPTESPTVSLHNLQGTWSNGSGTTEVYLNVKNLFDDVQPSPLVAPDDPFGENFDTAYVYGSMRGRHLLFGVRYGLAQ